MNTPMDDGGDRKQQLPTATFWSNNIKICQIEGFWYLSHYMNHVKAFKSGFQPRNDDVLLTSYPKGGTTWLLALAYNVLDTDRGDNEEEDILAKKNPHDVIPTMENHYLEDFVQDMLQQRDDDDDDDDEATGRRRRRLFHTHFPYSYLPEKVTAAGSEGCKVVYVARNPKDTLVSMWHFLNKNSAAVAPPFPLEKAVETFCSGVMAWGPFFEHVVSYWEASRKRPDQVLFLKYEELCREPEEQVRKLAAFLGRRELADVDVEKVLWRSSLNRLKEVAVNKPLDGGAAEEAGKFVSNSAYFRKGTVGDWKKWLTPDMARRIDQLTRIKLQGTGLSFDDGNDA